MTARVLFLATFVAGLGLAVYSMLHGVERSRTMRRGVRTPAKPGAKPPSAIFNAPTGSTFAIVLGAIGYLLVTRATIGLGTIFAIGLTLAAAATAGVIVLMSKWASKWMVSGIHSPPRAFRDPRFRMTPKSSSIPLKMV